MSENHIEDHDWKTIVLREAAQNARWKFQSAEKHLVLAETEYKAAQLELEVCRTRYEQLKEYE